MDFPEKQPGGKNVPGIVPVRRQRAGEMPAGAAETALFPDAEAREDLVQDVRCSGLARDAADEFGGGAERTARKLPGSRLHAFAGGVEPGRGLFEQRGVSFGDGCAAGLHGGRKPVPGGRFEAAEEALQSIAGPCGNMLENGLSGV